MAQDLRLLDGWLRESQWPYVACPACMDGVLAPASLTGLATVKSSQTYDDTRNPLDLTGSFYGILRCNLEACGEGVVVTGDYDVDVHVQIDGRARECDFYRLRYAHPALKIIVPPKDTPPAVSEAIEAASRLIWADPGAAANRLRFAVEAFLTAYGMRRYVNKNGSRYALSTHARIVEFKEDDPEVGDTLEAVKWIGNTGSHETELTATEVLEGAEFFAYALRLMYDDSERVMQKRIRKVNQAKGLPKRRKSSKGS